MEVGEKKDRVTDALNATKVTHLRLTCQTLEIHLCAAVVCCTIKLTVAAWVTATRSSKILLQVSKCTLSQHGCRAQELPNEAGLWPSCDSKTKLA